MRLAHKIGLHSRASSQHLDSSTIRQRSCVFWIAYILDKHLSICTKQPSIQLDDDIDIDLPSPEFDGHQLDKAHILENTMHETGIIATVNGAARINYFLARIQLAVIEGGIYDYLYSVRSQKRSHEERARALESVARALELWSAAIPPEFCPGACTKSVRPTIQLLFHEIHDAARWCRSSIDQVAAQAV
jgi:hypothetical protein